MFNADEARKVANNFKEEKFKRELDGIYNQIKECAENGEYEVHFDKYVSKRAKEILQKDGYKIKYHTKYNEATTTIRW